MEYRIEHDSMGEVKSPQINIRALRPKEATRISPIGRHRDDAARDHRRFRNPEKAAALANNKLVPERMTVKAPARSAPHATRSSREGPERALPARRMADGKRHSVNMNANEVIANRANEIAGKKLLHPNDDINMSPVVKRHLPDRDVHLRALALEDRVIPAVKASSKPSSASRAENEGIVKARRTHLQDATPIKIFSRR